ncbi:recombinase family protein [Mucilaginibacter gotjawali]|uniref:DNA invertase Pin-like site-specific DNA recombinase n=1 Tax=Mucilaginibacter gotjawali TaxID=1550579 RepID=A0A839SEY9_9SPHI|nr:recombinase family protein [Mucilaginibacter gotjawali]MBB3056811.1 DNA invertase Pin-like site-specific DNA recombinase [Mucilaginibacter gotjawali]
MAKNKLKTLPNHLGIYIRVSTQQQANEGISTHEQRESGISKANLLGWTYTIYDDSAQSGSISYLDRPGMRQLMLDVDAGKLGGMFSVDIDRWSRDGKYEEPQIIISIFKSSGIKIFTPSGELNLQDPNIEFMSRIQGLTSSYYRIQTQIKIKRALVQSAKEGNAGGGPLLPYGYKKVKKLLVINPEEAKVVELIFKMYIDGKGTFVIADYLNMNKIPTRRNLIQNGQMTIKRGERRKANGEVIPEGKVIKSGDDFRWRDKTVLGMLKNPIYKGQRRYRELTVESPIIIDPIVFDTVQNLIEDKKHFREAPYSKSGATVNKFLLKGLIKCGQCGQSFYGKKRIDIKRDNAYCCLSQRYKGKFCGTNGISIEYLDDLVWSEVKKIKQNVLEYFKNMEEGDDIKTFKDLLHKSEKEIEELNKNLLNLNRRYNEGKLTDIEYNPLRMEYLNELSHNQGNKDHFLSKLNSLHQKESVLQVIENFTEKIKDTSLNFEEKQSIIRALISGIKITPKHAIYIRYKLDKLTDVLLDKEYEIGYKPNGHRIGIVGERLLIGQINHKHAETGHTYNSIYHVRKDE